MLECVANVSEGRDGVVLARLAEVCAASLLDLHADLAHNRSVFTLAGPQAFEDAVALCREALRDLNLEQHEGVHPRLGTVDVVPFVPLGSDGFDSPFELSEAIVARDRFARTISAEFGLPCFLYGPERSLPEIRRLAFSELEPDFGPPRPHRRAGACCVGARGVLIAYNVVTTGLTRERAAAIVRAIRVPELRALSFAVGATWQISCNLVDPARLGLAEVYDRISSLVADAGGKVIEAELVGLVPRRALEVVPAARWSQLGLDDQSSIEARLANR